MIPHASTIKKGDILETFGKFFLENILPKLEEMGEYWAPLYRTSEGEQLFTNSRVINELREKGYKVDFSNSESHELVRIYL